MPVLQVYHLHFRSLYQPSIFLSFTLSFILHIVIIGMLVFFQNRTFIKEREKYITVSIYINKEPAGAPLISSVGAGHIPQEKAVQTTGTPRLMPKEISGDALIEERIHAIKAKKRIEKIARLRAVITIAENQRAGVEEQNSENISQMKNLPEPGSAPKGMPGYVDIVRTTIQGNWHYPELAKKGLTATVIIYVGKDGAVKTIDFKTSGERLFDYSVKNAILKSSPLPSPPEECEIELRFSR